MSNVEVVDAESHFNKIKKTDANGSEYWLARELMELMDYARWEDAALVLERAKAACSNSGHDADSHFHKFADPGTRQNNYRLSRFGAYLTAMNGNPSRPEVAAAQSYFAVKTREAEVTQSSAPISNFDVLQGMLDQLRSADQRITEVEQSQVEFNSRVADLEGCYKWVSATGYASRFGLPKNAQKRSALMKLGKLAGIIGRKQDLQPQEVDHPTFGKVNAWPEEVWHEAWEQYQAAQS